MGHVANNSGISLVEVITAVAVLGIAIPPIAAMFREVAQNSPDDLYQNAAVHAANSLMEEIVSKSFEDPELPPGSFGREEVFRADYDDIDDFDGYVYAPTQAPVVTPVDGVVGVIEFADSIDEATVVPIDAFLSSLDGISLAAIVENVDASDTDPSTAQPDGSTAYKRITVSASWTVGRGGEVRFKTLRTDLPDFIASTGPLDELGSSGSATADVNDSVDIVLINRSDEPLVISTVRVSADRATPRLSQLRFGLRNRPMRPAWIGLESLPTPELAPFLLRPEELTIPPNSFIGSRVDFLNPPSPGPMTLFVTYSFTDGSTSSLTLPLEWD